VHYAYFPLPVSQRILSPTSRMSWIVRTSALLRPLHVADSNCISSRQGFGRGNTKSNQNLKAAAAYSPSTTHPPMPSMTNSPSISSTYSAQSDEVYQEQPKKFLNERYAKCSVKGNFLTLAAQPKNVELGEWLAHQGRTAILQTLYNI